MNARELQTAIAEDLRVLFKESIYKSPPPKINGFPSFNMTGYDPETPPLEPEQVLEPIMERLGVYEQELPIREKGANDPFPYIIVRIQNGGVESPVAPHKVTVFILIGIYDDDKQNIGHKSVLEIIERIQSHYEEKPTLDGGIFQFADPFTWVLQDEPSFPYFYGACNLTFNLAAPRTKGSKYT